MLEPLFLINQAVAMIFLCDFVLQFNLVQQIETADGDTRWMSDRASLARHYLRGCGWSSTCSQSSCPSLTSTLSRCPMLKLYSSSQCLGALASSPPLAAASAASRAAWDSACANSAWLPWSRVAI